MNYILMCGGKYNNFETPKHLLKVCGEVITERTIRQLRENGIEDIAISTENPAFDYLKVPILKHENSYEFQYGKITGWWIDAFYPTDEPTCYIFGDVYFSDEAIKKIIETETNDIELFGSMPPFCKDYPKNWIEPFALKVENTDHLKKAVEKTKQLAKEGKTWRKNPIMWDLWTVIKDVPLQTKAGEYEYNYTAINDYTSDIDHREDAEKLEWFIKKARGELNMVKAEVTETFNLKDYDKIEAIHKKSVTPHEFIRGDIIKCDDEMAKYLDGDNALKKSFIKILEVIPAKVVIQEEAKEEVEPVEIKSEELWEESKIKEQKKPKNTTKSKGKKLTKK